MIKRIYYQGIMMDSTDSSKQENHPSPNISDTTTEQRLHDALIHLQGGRLNEAKILYQAVLDQQPNQPIALHTLGLLNYQAGDPQSAIQLIERAISVKPDFAEACNNLASIHLELGQLENAVAEYRRAINISPNLVEAHYNLATIYQTQHRLDDAIRHYQEVLTIKPDLKEARERLGEALHLSSRAVATSAEDVDLPSEISLQRQQQRAIQSYNQAVLCEQQDKPEEAIVHYKQALAAKPDFPEAHNNLGNVLMSQGRFTEALVCFQNTISLNSNSIHALNNIGNVLKIMGRLVEATVSLQAALSLDPYSEVARSNLISALSYRSDYDTSALFSEYVRWGELHGRDPMELMPHNNVPDEKKRLRIGYVSPDFRHHPVGYFIEQILAHHDKSSFEIYCYSNRTINDDVTQRLRRHADHWCDIVGQPDEAVIQKIRNDGIDILIDLAGHTMGHSLMVFAQKPAPVQATWIGDPATTGLPAMDYIIADRFAIPTQEEQYYVEKVVRLPNAYECFSPPDYPIEPGPLPALTTGRITFGCLNNNSKINDAVIACWSKLLHSLPEARLYLKYTAYSDPGVRQRYRELFTGHGIDTDRIILSGYSPREEFLSAYGEVDIGLDPFPYNGGLTTLEAMWMGVPVVSLHGNRFVSRMGETLLINTGLTECVVDSEDDYIAKAISLASDLPRLADLRSRLRSQLLNSPVCDGAGFTRDLESAYRKMWETWCRSQAKT